MEPIRFDDSYKKHVNTETMYQAVDDIDVLELCVSLKSPEQIVTLVTDLFRKNANDSNQQYLARFISNIHRCKKTNMYGLFHKQDNFFEYWPGHDCHAFCVGFFNSLYGTDPEDIAEAFDVDYNDDTMIVVDGKSYLNVSEIQKHQN